MRITTYKAYIDKNQHNYLVKDISTNYSSLNDLDSPNKVYEIMKNIFHLNICAEEFLYLICLNSKLTPTAFFEISHGSVNSSLLNLRELFIRAFLSAGVSIILCHNHPSTDTTPSKADITTTNRLKNACEIMNINLADHIIIGRDGFYSFKEHNIL